MIEFPQYEPKEEVGSITLKTVGAEKLKIIGSKESAQVGSLCNDSYTEIIDSLVQAGYPVEVIPTRGLERVEVVSCGDARLVVITQIREYLKATKIVLRLEFETPIAADAEEYKESVRRLYYERGLNPGAYQ